MEASGPMLRLLYRVAQGEPPRMGQRISIEIPGFEHDNPIPAACRVGPFLITSGVSGKEPFTGKYPEGIELQCAQMFASVREILKAAGASPEDIAKINVWIKDRALRPHVNKEWLAIDRKS